MALSIFLKCDRRKNGLALIVKYGSLGDIVILMHVLRYFNDDRLWKNVKFAIPIKFHRLFKHYFPHAKCIELPVLREGVFKAIVYYFKIILAAKYNRVMLLGGSRSPVEEDLFAACSSPSVLTSNWGDMTKSNKFLRAFNSRLYSNCNETACYHEFDIIYEQISNFVDPLQRQEEPAPLIHTRFRHSDIKKILLFCGASDKKRSIDEAGIYNICIELIRLFPDANVILCGAEFELNYFDDFIFKKLNALHVKMDFNIGSFEELFKKIDDADLVVCNDSAPLHISKFLNKNSITICGEGHLSRFAQYSKKTEVVSAGLDCKNCSWKCRHALSVSGRYKCVSLFEKITLKETNIESGIVIRR